MSKQMDAEAPFPVEVGRYLADTPDLTALHHGCYWLILMAYWKHGPLQANLTDLSVICKTERERFARDIWPKLSRFFKRDPADGLLHQKRLDIVRAKRDKAAAPKGKKPKTPRITADGPEFDAFWHAYPRKVGRGAAVKAFVSASRRAEVATIMAGLARFLKNLPREMQFVPYAATWLNQDRWTDEQRRPDASPVLPGALPPRGGSISQEEAARLGL